MRLWLAPASASTSVALIARGDACPSRLRPSLCAPEGASALFPARPNSGRTAGQTIEAKPVFGQTQSIRGREVDGTDGTLSGTRKATTAFLKRRSRHRVGHNRPAPQ